MTSPLEYQNRPSRFNAKIGQVLCEGEMVGDGETIHVCAWHEGQARLTERITAAGYRASHGLCHDCGMKFFEPKL